MNKAEMETVDLMLDALEQQGAQQEPRPLGNELLWGNYNVAYTSTSRAMNQRGNRELLQACASYVVLEIWKS